MKYKIDGLSERENPLSPEATLIEAIRAIEISPRRMTVVVAPEGHLLGTLTDGDIRRHLLIGGTLDDLAEKAMNVNPIISQKGSTSVSMQDLMRKNNVNALPIVDQSGLYLELLHLMDLVDDSVVTDALDMSAIGGPTKIHESALKALVAGADLLCFSGMGDQSQFVSSSLDWISQAIQSGGFDLDTLDEQVKHVRAWRHPKIVNTPAVNGIDFRELIQGFEISGSVELAATPINLIEIGTKPTIAAGDVSWGIHRELRAVGIGCDIHASDAESLSSKRLVVAFRDAYRDDVLLATLNRLSVRHPDAIFIDMGWPTREFSPKNLIRAFGSSAVISQAVAARILGR